ncbi:hypothetical protein Verru16b_01813 [Lacunisphaera limnophila]|uniref:DUF4154 domain-containing protein n=1 Tax=Lacunisphaera limnophila TaxID=1838286 RepID=A0A1D8AV53_9BACT|nr:YfiR family protein [Lacunisphaera limnophila]AOS44745.1 hypothetical protein Verru16b_01813 [Lacunisphaera limnophila]
MLLLAPGLAAAPLPVPPVAAIAPAVMPEYSVKAAYLVRFTRYIEWPAGTFADASAPIVIGVLGRNPFGDLLVKSVAGVRSQGREVQVRVVANLEETAGCHVIFIGRGQERDEALWLEALRQRPVVTVTDSPEGLARGAILSLYVEEKAAGSRVVFGASLPAARRAGLQLSAAMLPSARQLIRGEEADPGEGV